MKAIIEPIENNPVFDFFAFLVVAPFMIVHDFRGRCLGKVKGYSP